METEEKKKVFNMTKEDFEEIPERGEWSRDIGEFDSLIIIPQNHVHDSGWMCMDFVAVNKDGEPICRLSGCSDVLNLDGIGEVVKSHALLNLKDGALTVCLAAV